VEVQLEILHI